jgi:hypothetical protein
VKWRTSLGIAVGLLLPVFFMYVHSEVVRWRRWSQAGTLQGARVVPILAQDERRALLTYGRTCQEEKDCDPPLTCLNLFPSGEPVCVDSSCLTDLQCKQGFTCRAREALNQAAVVRRCVLIGSRQKGQPCFDGAAEPEDACGQGLFCVNGHCGRPCQLDVPSSCPAGFVCRAGLDGPSCQPFCKGGDCPTGQQCVSPGTDEARCMIVQGENCQRSPCAEGLECNITSTPEKEAWSARMECLVPCDEKRACPEDSMCFLGGCRRRCGPEATDVCGPRKRCVLFPVDKFWICMSSPD